jgi:GntR family transcriptional regulator / MocR family aminotransferase
MVLCKGPFSKMKQTTSRDGKSGNDTRASDWAMLHDWAVERGSSTPLFRQVYLQCRAAILGRRLRPGTKLPSTRALASRLGIARASIVAAYDQLFAEGYLSGRIGSGTYISADLPELIEVRSAKKAKLSESSPTLSPKALAFATIAETATRVDQRPFATARVLLDGRTIDSWRKLSQRAIRTFDPIHQGYSDARGLPELRQAICEYLGVVRGIQAEPEQVIITSGTQHGVDIATRVLLSPGDQVWVEDPSYLMTRNALEAAGIRLCPVPVDGQGLDVRAGVRVAPKARAAFITPSHQYPLGVVLSMPRRLELLAWAREVGAWIIEDDYHSEYRYGGRPLAALQGLDEAGRVVYLGTLNKVLFPGLRLGYVVMPLGLVKSFIGARYFLDRQAPTLTQSVVAEFMRQGYFTAHIRRMRFMYRDQRDLLVSQLQRRLSSEVSVAAPEQGMHLVAFLREGLSDVSLEVSLRSQGIVVRALSVMYRRAPCRQGFVLGFTGFPKQSIGPAVARMATVVLAQNELRQLGGDKRSVHPRQSHAARRS